ncbi:hypothetical protein Tco_0734470, partial [Tanacetum coccineum]
MHSANQRLKLRCKGKRKRSICVNQLMLDIGPVNDEEPFAEVSFGFFSPHYLPKVRESAAAKPHQDARKMTQDKTRIPNHRDMALSRHTALLMLDTKLRNIYRSSHYLIPKDQKQQSSLTKEPILHKPGRQNGIGQRFSLNKSSAVHEKPHTPRSYLSLTEAEDAVAREVHATHARIVSGPDLEPMQEDQTGSNSGKLHVSLAGSNPEHMDDEFLATAYLKVHENLKLITDERVIEENPESHSGSMSSMKNLDDTYNFGDQFLYDKLTEDDQEKSKVIEESDSTIPDPSHQTVTSTPPVIAPFTDVSSTKPS